MHIQLVDLVRVIEAELGVVAVIDAHHRQDNQPVNQCLGPLNDDISDLGTSRNVEDVCCGIANTLGIGGVGMNGNPHNDGVKSFVLAIIDNRGVSCVEGGVVETMGLHQHQNLRINFIPHIVE